ncbi:MAG TPA: CRISPR-associated endonuclease Cas1 [Desulfobacteraceae bacterium]|nr:CRISPR-associated endonuclease Cas1 [Desulfobacteraceae bacterium]
MATVYIISDFGKVVKKGDVLQVKRNDDILKTIFPFRTEQLVIIGKVEITSAAIRFLMHHRIETVFLGRNGRFNGRIDFQTGKNVFLRRRQYELLGDNLFRLRFARAVINAKVRNQLSFVQRIARRNYSNANVNQVVSSLKSALRKIELCDNFDSLRGYEGNSARHYFSVFKQALLPEWATFNGRSMHPPLDNVNAVLSLLYTMILFRVDAAVQAKGMDAYAGFYHSLDYGKKSLVFDLMEEYRTPIADTLTVALFNLGVLKPDDFRVEEFAANDDEFPLEHGDLSQEEIASIPEKKVGVLLTPEGLKKVITQFEKKLEDGIFHVPLMKNLTYRQLIDEQADLFKRVVIGQEDGYKPLQIK